MSGMTRLGEMRLSMTVWLVIAAASLGSLLLGCSTGVYSPSEEESGNAGSGPDVETVMFAADPESGEISFQTNDPAYIGPSGRSLWHMGNVTQEPLTEVRASIYKLSGKSEMGYGITFAMQDINNFLTVMITTTGYYMIGRVEGQEREFTALTADQDWQYSEELLQGYNRSNQIRVTYDNGTGQFTLYLNNDEQQNFVDNSDNPLTGGAFGHIVTFSPYENFPDQRLHAVFDPEVPADIGIVSEVGGDTAPSSFRAAKLRSGSAGRAFGTLRGSGAER